MINLIHGDCLEELKKLDDNSVDSIVTDPPYGLSFMGKKWDYDVPSEDVWRECFRVLKPGGHLLAFAGTRTQHRMAVRIEDAGFEIRDMIAWVYGSGFPKSLDISKAIDKAAGAEREYLGEGQYSSRKPRPYEGGHSLNISQNDTRVGNPITAPATEAAKQWKGWGTALKPALEPITVARKPLIGTVAENVLTYGTGGLNIDGCRVEAVSEQDLKDIRLERPSKTSNANEYTLNHGGLEGLDRSNRQHISGRFPANLIHDGSEEVMGLFPENKSNPKVNSNTKPNAFVAGGSIWNSDNTYSNSGSAARFFYCAKASKKDRDEGLEGFEEHVVFKGNNEGRDMTNEKNHLGGMQSTKGRNVHPTVKPTDLMRYLCRLVTPPGGTVLDPFMGSGSTGKAAKLEGFNFIGIEREAEYVEIARARIEAVDSPMF